MEVHSAEKVERSVVKGIESKGSTRPSYTVLGIEWEKYFPLDLGDSITGELTDGEGVLRFLREKDRFSKLRSAGGVDLLESRKQLYYTMMGDCFCLKKDGEMIAVMAGALHDWTTYYFRYVSILPAYEGRGHYQKLLKHVLSILAAYGVERAEADVSPANFTNIQILNRLRFMVTGYRATDRWGNLLVYTKYLEGKPETDFLEKCCFGFPKVRDASSIDQIGAGSSVPERGHS